MSRSIAAPLFALTLGAFAVSAVQAQPTSFGMFFGDEREDFLPNVMVCLTDYQVRQAVADRGYSDIYLNVMQDTNVEVRATRDGWVYLLDFNFCTGRVEGRTQLRPAQ